MNSALSCCIILFILGRCSSSPICCQKASYYADFLLTLKCGFSVCKSNETIVENFCIFCSPPTLPSSQDIALGVARPYALCQSIEVQNQTLYGHLLMSWPWLDLASPSLFIVEARNFSRYIGEWGFVGMTNQTFADLTHLELELEYQFRITPVLSSRNTSITSAWISLSGLNQSISSPKNLSVAEFHLNRDHVDAIITWNASKETPCSYKIYWLPAMSIDSFQQRTITLPQDSLSTTLPALLFSTNYTVTVSAYDPHELRKVPAAKVWFVTPSCLTLTGGNFSICAPGPPLNVSAQWLSSSSEVLLMWIPPEHSSFLNEVSSFQIAIAEATGIFQNILQYKSNHVVGKNITKAKFSNLKLIAHYVFEIRAISHGGTGLPAIAEINTRNLAALSLAGYAMPYYYIVPALTVPLVATLVLVLRRSCRKTRKQGYPTGLADVHDDLRPFLIPSDKIELREIIGQGAFAVVHRAVYTRNKSKDEVAVKVFPSETSTRRQLLQEMDVLRIVGRHDNVVGFIGFALDIEKMFLLFEYCRLGNLHSHLVGLKPELMHMKSIPTSERPNYTNQKGHGLRLASYIYQVAQGMEYISSLKLIHRDIAARNILLYDEKKVKIGDFGLSKDVYETKNYATQTQKKLPIKWMAPEAIEKQKFNTSTDVWSFGVFMWEVYKLGKEPYPGLKSTNILQYLKMGFRLEKPHCSQEWYDIMSACWRSEPRQRPRFKDLVTQIEEVIEASSHYTMLS